MKKVICKVEYDTDRAVLVGKVANGTWGDPKGFEETLYKTAEGKYFLYTFGGEESPYPEENIKRMSAPKAEEWIQAHIESKPPVQPVVCSTPIRGDYWLDP